MRLLSLKTENAVRAQSRFFKRKARSPDGIHPVQGSDF